MKKASFRHPEFVSGSKRQVAFSLVEMLMALLVASLLLAALAPVMTRKMTENVNVFGTGGGGNAPAMFKCWDYDDPALQLASDGSGYKVLPEDFKIDDAWIVNFILASGGGGGAGATKSAVVADSYTEPNEGKNGIKIEYNMDDFEIETMTGGGGGAGGGAAVHSSATCTGGASVDKCECMGQKYDSVNKVCVSGNLGSKNLANAKTACSNLAPSSKWQIPTMAQLGNWKNQYSNYGIKSGNTVWSRDTSACSKTETKPSTCFRAWHSNPGYWHCDDAPGYCCTAAMCSSSRHSYDGECVAFNKNLPTTTSCGTNYHYYTLSGSSWNAVTNINTNTNSRLTYCMYNDSGNVTGEKFYSLSGGGGGGSAGIIDNDFDLIAKKKLRDKIRENIGGYIVLDIGEGGRGGNGASSKGGKASNGTNGSDSCIIVQNSARVPQFKLCVKGGNGGYGADASKTNASTDGYGRGGTSVAKDNGCYTYDYTLSANQRVEFSCSAAGKAAGNGGAGTNNPTAGGKGGASVLNSNQVSNSGKDGVTPNATTSPGAGGGGGSATKSGFGSSATFAFGKGGDGAKGYIKLKYKHNYEAAGGGGGGAGYVGHIKNINVGKSATCSIKVGYGGIGGNGASGSASAIKGGDGGASSIVCSNAPNVTYRIFGGKGGSIGTSASTASGSSSVGGLGGAAGSYDDTGNIFTRLFSQGNFTGYKGLEGKAGGSGDAANYKEGTRSAGGRGGTSGTGEKGKCGGLYNEAGVCSSVNIIDDKNNIEEPNQNSLNGQGFSGGDINIPTKDSIVEANPKFGKAGAGGGGGAWYIGKDPGKGGNGQGGYVCIYWDKLE